MLRSLFDWANSIEATCFVHIIALVMAGIMLFHVRSKYTAVGRKEIVLFFYMYMFIELLAIFLDSAIIPTSHVVYPVSSPTESACPCLLLL